MIDARSDSHLWKRNYDRDLADVFAVQSDVAEKVADALQAQLLPAESARFSGAPTANVHTHDLYLHARNLFDQLQISSVAEPVAVGRYAANRYRQAIAADPDFALAYAWLSYLQSYRHGYNVDTSPTLVAEARENARKALAAARSAAAQIPLSRDPMVGAFNLERLARTQAQVGATESAIQYLRQLLEAPAGSIAAVPILRIDPAWDPLRNDPGFQALLTKYADDKPAPAANQPASGSSTPRKGNL